MVSEVIDFSPRIGEASLEPTLVGLHRSRAESLRAGEESPGGCTIPTFRDQNVVDLTMLIDRVVKTNRSGGQYRRPDHPLQPKVKRLQ